MSKIERSLKEILWQRYATSEHPAEWDGIHFGGGGGKLSQRFWEYYKFMEHLDVDENSVVLDIGGWSNDRGAGFFGRILAQRVKKVLIIDPTIKDAIDVPANIQLISDFASYDTLKEIFKANPGITHVSCVSVFEHIEPSVREGIVQAVNDHFKGDIFVASYEYHTKSSFFEYQLTVKSASKLFGSLTNFFLTAYEASPSLAENAFANPWYRGENKKSFNPFEKIFKKIIPLWYPVIVKFERSALVKDESR